MAIQLQVKIKGGKEFAKVLENADPIARKSLADGLNRSAIFFQRKSRGYAPVRTSNLRGSINLKPAMVNDNPILAEVGTNVKYAKYQEFGTGIYAGNSPIRPKRPGGVLRFKTKGGKIVYTRKVKGTRPRKFMQKARDDVQPVHDRNMEKALKEITTYLAEA